MKRILTLGSTGFLAREFKSCEPAGWRSYGLSQRLNGTQVEERMSSSSSYSIVPGSSYAGVVFFQGLPPRHTFGELDPVEITDHFNAAIGLPTLVINNLMDHLTVGASVLFISSTSILKGSYDPYYGAAQAAKIGLAASVQRFRKDLRVNVIQCGLIENSPVHLEMTEDFREMHRNANGGNSFVSARNVSSLAWHIIQNTDIRGAIIPIDGGLTGFGS